MAQTRCSAPRHFQGPCLELPPEILLKRTSRVSNLWHTHHLLLTLASHMSHGECWTCEMSGGLSCAARAGRCRRRCTARARWSGR